MIDSKSRYGFLKIPLDEPKKRIDKKMLNIFSIKDIKHDSFANPFFAKNVPEAMRQIIMATDNPNSMLGKFPHDFVLYQNGSFMEDTGRLVEFPDPVMISPVSSLANRSTSVGGPQA